MAKQSPWSREEVSPIDEGNMVAVSNWYRLDGEKKGRIVLYIKPGRGGYAVPFVTHLETAEGGVHALCYGRYDMTLKVALEDFSQRVYEEFHTQIQGKR